MFIDATHLGRRALLVVQAERVLSSALWIQNHVHGSNFMLSVWKRRVSQAKCKVTGRTKASLCLLQTMFSSALTYSQLIDHVQHVRVLVTFWRHLWIDSSLGLWRRVWSSWRWRRRTTLSLWKQREHAVLVSAYCSCFGESVVDGFSVQLCIPTQFIRRRSSAI